MASADGTSLCHGHHSSSRSLQDRIFTDAQIAQEKLSALLFHRLVLNDTFYSDHFLTVFLPNDDSIYRRVDLKKKDEPSEARIDYTTLSA